MKSFSLLCLIPVVASAPGYSFTAFSSPKFSFGYSNGGPQYYNNNNNNNGYGRSFGSNSGYGRSFGRNQALSFTRGNLRTGDIISDTRILSEQVQNTLNQLSSSPTAVDIINKIINDKDNTCLGSLEDAIDAIETGTKLVESAGDDIKELITKVNGFGALTDPVKAVREIADILRIVEPVVTKITPENPTSICIGTFGSLRNLASVIDELSDSKKIALTFPVRSQLKESARKISAVNAFLNQLKSTSAKLTKICTADKQYNIQAISSVGDLMVDLADLFGTLGGVKDGDQIRKGKDYVNKIVAQLNKIGDLGLGDINCESQGDFKAAANTMDDLAVLIEEVGLEDLQKQLGVDLSFVFSP